MSPKAERKEITCAIPCKSIEDLVIQNCKKMTVLMFGSVLLNVRLCSGVCSSVDGCEGDRGGLAWKV